MRKLHNKKGFTLIELITVIAIVAILVGLAMPVFVNLIQQGKSTADKVTLRTLNNITTVYGSDSRFFQNDIFEGYNTNKERLLELVKAGLLNDIVKPQVKETEFVWVIEEQKWVIAEEDSTIPLSPLGSTFEEISEAMIDLMIQRLIEEGAYGRTWGDYAFTDIGLDPKDWKNPIGNIYYKPVGSRLQIRPAEGYQFIVEDIYGNTRTLTNRSNHNLIYNDIDKKWYIQSISEGNTIDISTMKIQQGGLQ